MKQAAIDVGGTFTDCLIMDEEGEVRQFKVPSTPPDYASGLIASLEKAARFYALSTAEFMGQLELILHGTTVASNAILTGDGARTGMITTKGFRDICEIRRGMRLSSMYNLFIPPYQPLVPRYRRLGVAERTLHTGKIMTPLSKEDVKKAAKSLQKQGVQSIAVCFLHSYANPENERRAVDLCRKLYPGVFVTASHEILPVWREYERFSTTVAAAYIGPVVDRYLNTLENRLKHAGFGGSLLIVLSNGLVQSVDEARKRSIYMIGSGPAAGPSAGVYWGSRTGHKDIISLDIGGTTSDIALIANGDIPTTSEAWVGDERIAVKKVDSNSFEGGGGSIAWIDPLGVLRIGPRSSASVPGPVCYDRGGTEPTVLDASLLLGYIAPDFYLGGEMPLRMDLAEQAIVKLGRQLGIKDPVQMATAIFSLANTVIAGHITKTCTKRGFDPRDYVLMSAGGGGGLHAAWIADRLDIPVSIVPRFTSFYSAFGMFTAEVGMEFNRSYPCSAHQMDFAKLNRVFEEMQSEARAKLMHVAESKDDIIMNRSADMRYHGQFHELESDMPGGKLGGAEIQAALSAFDKRHEQLYAFAMPGREVEFFTFRLRARVRAKKPITMSLRAEGNGDPAHALKTRRTCFFEGKPEDTPVYDGERLRNRDAILGPALIQETTTTVVVPERYRCVVDATGTYQLRVS
jgi:N-methylhydantoinase A